MKTMRDTRRGPKPWERCVDGVVDVDGEQGAEPHPHQNGWLHADANIAVVTLSPGFAIHLHHDHSSLVGWHCAN